MSEGKSEPPPLLKKQKAVCADLESTDMFVRDSENHFCEEWLFHLNLSDVDVAAPRT